MNAYLEAMALIGITGMIPAIYLIDHPDSKPLKRFLTVWFLLWLLPPLAKIWINGVLS